MLVDIELVEFKLQELNRYLAQLKKHQGVTASALKNDLDKSWIIQHGLQLSIQVVLDVGNHILAAEGIAIHEYEDIFAELARLKIISDKYAQSIKGMAGFRNLLVHEYARIDMEKLTDILDNRLKDFSLFASYISDYLARQNDTD